MAFKLSFIFQAVSLSVFLNNLYWPTHGRRPRKPEYMKHIEGFFAFGQGVVILFVDSVFVTLKEARLLSHFLTASPSFCVRFWELFPQSEAPWPGLRMRVGLERGQRFDQGLSRVRPCFGLGLIMFWPRFNPGLTKVWPRFNQGLNKVWPRLAQALRGLQCLLGSYPSRNLCRRWKIQSGLQGVVVPGRYLARADGECGLVGWGRRCGPDVG